jgi:hypothetical protein
MAGHSLRDSFDMLVSPRMLDEEWRLPDGREIAAGAPAEAAAGGALLVLDAAEPAAIIDAFAADFTRLSGSAVARALVCRAAVAPGVDTDVLARAASGGKSALAGELALTELLAESGEGALLDALEAAQRAVFAVAGAPGGLDVGAAFAAVARADANAAPARAFIEAAPASEVFAAFAARVAELAEVDAVCELVARAARREPLADRSGLWRASWEQRSSDARVAARIARMLGDEEAVLSEELLVEVTVAFAAHVHDATPAWLALVAPRCRVLAAMLAGCMRVHREAESVTPGPYSAAPRRIARIEDDFCRLVRATEGRCPDLHATAVIQATYASDLVLWGHLLLCADARVTALYRHRLRHDSPRIIGALLHALYEPDGERVEPLRQELAGHPDPLVRCMASSLARSPARRAAERAAQLVTIAPEWQIDVNDRIQPNADEPAEAEPVALAPSATVLEALTAAFQHLRVKGVLAARRAPETALAFALAIEIDIMLAARGYKPAVLGAGIVDAEIDAAGLAALFEPQLRVVRAARFDGPPPGQRLSPALEECLAHGPAGEVERIAGELGAPPGPDLEPWLADELTLLQELPAALRRWGKP